MLKARGTIKVESKKSRIVVETGSGILDFYEWFIRKKYWIRLQKPLHGAHISIALASKHKKVNWQRAEYYDGEEIEFEYDPYLIRGGYTKGFIMFYLKVYSETIDKLKKELNIVDSDGYRGLHLTIGQSGKGGSKPLLYWPELITIKK
jgi:hypothetical protein